MLGKLVRLLLLAALAGYAFRLVWGRGSLFFQAWRGARKDYYMAQRQHEACSSNHEHRHTFEETCDKADRIMEVWPIIRATGELMDQTYLCIEVPCSTIVVDIISTWPGLILMCSMPIVLFSVAVCYLRSLRTQTVVHSPASGWTHQPYGGQSNARVLGWSGGAGSVPPVV